MAECLGQQFMVALIVPNPPVIPSEAEESKDPRNLLLIPAKAEVHLPSLAP